MVKAGKWEMSKTEGLPQICDTCEPFSEDEEQAFRERFRKALAYSGRVSSQHRARSRG